MAEILRPTSQLPLPSSSVNTDGFEQQSLMGDEALFNTGPVALLCRRDSTNSQFPGKGGDQLSVLESFATVFRRSFVGCGSISAVTKEQLMEIGWPTNVRHVAHVTFDRFNGFLGLPVEFEPEVPRRPPSARSVPDWKPLLYLCSTRVFGVSTESMQLSFDSRGNCVPTILLMMQRRLYSQGGLQSEGIFRINPENGQEEYVREQLNNGLIPDNIDVHCLAGLIKAWFRELPKGILDSVTPERVLQAQSEDKCSHIVRLLPVTEAALLDWAINLMADVAQFESMNKMNARNIAMVFAPNMTKMSDPLTALMYAVQVMNFLRTLIVKTLKERQDSVVDPASLQVEPSDDDGHHSTFMAVKKETASEETQRKQAVYLTPHAEHKSNSDAHAFFSSIDNILPSGTPEICNTNHRAGGYASITALRIRRAKREQEDVLDGKKGARKQDTPPAGLLRKPHCML